MQFSCGIEINEKVQCLLFDLDGTLVDNMHLHVEAWMMTGDEFKVPITAEMIHINAGIPTRQLIEKLSQEYNWKVDYELFTQSKQSRYKQVKKDSGQINIIEPIVEIARYYKDDLPMGIGTGSSRSNALSALEEANMLNWFGVVVAAEDVKHPKPHPEVYLKGAKILGVDPEYCLVLEDGNKGIQSAVEAGMDFIDVRKYLNKG